MPRRDGPHMRNQRPGRLDRGSRRRLAALTPFTELPPRFWFAAVIVIFLLGLCVVLIWEEIPR
jgi:hypothetical protein